MGKSAWDIAAMLEVMVPGDPSYTQYTSPPFSDISRYKLGVPRIGFPSDKPTPLSPADQVTMLEAESRFADALRELKGGIKVDPADIENVEQLWAAAHEHGWDEAGRWKGSAEHLGINTDVYASLNDHLTSLDDFHLKTIEDLVDWNNAHPVRCSPAL